MSPIMKKAVKKESQPPSPLFNRIFDTKSYSTNSTTSRISTGAFTTSLTSLSDTRKSLIPPPPTRKKGKSVKEKFSIALSFLIHKS